MTLMQLEKDGFCIVPGVFDSARVADLRDRIESATTDDADSALKSRGTVFAARNLIDTIPDLIKLVDGNPLDQLLRETIGAQYGLVRALYFDKPSDRSWNLPLHKDLTIAVKDNSLPSDVFCKPTHKAGVDHVEAPAALLENMLTLRIHLDTVTTSNGPLEVIPGSHQCGKRAEPSSQPAVKILVDQGDVLAMRPLISHGSGHTNPEGNLRRRILHLEFSGSEQLLGRLSVEAFPSRRLEDMTSHRHPRQHHLPIETLHVRELLLDHFRFTDCCTQSLTENDASERNASIRITQSYSNSGRSSLFSRSPNKSSRTSNEV